MILVPKSIYMHGLILCVSEGLLSTLLHNYNVCIGVFDLH